VKHVAVKVIDRILLVAYGAADPSEEEWDEYLALVKRHGIERTMQLILTGGGQPTPAQRRRLNEVLAGRTVPVAIVSGSRVVRGTVTALSWFNRKIKAFPPSGLREAIAYLEIPATRAAFIEAELRKLQREVDPDASVPEARERYTPLAGEVLDRVDALAGRLGLTRPQMLAQIIRSGLPVIEARVSVPRIAVTIRPASSSSERIASFTAPERAFDLVVDQADVDEDESTLRVAVVLEAEGEVLVGFPRVPAEGPASAWLPRAMVLGLPSPGA
jgi:hypothetical protein